MVLTTAKPSNKEIREITQHYVLRPHGTSVSKLDFLLLSRNASFTEIEKHFEREFYKQNITWYFWNTASIRKRLPVFLTEQAVFDKIKDLEKLDKISTNIHISYIGQDAIEALLGAEGKKVLGKTLVLIGNTARRLKWPIRRLEIQYVSDIEVKDWNYVLLVLFFDSDLDAADKYLHLLYGELDSLATTLTSKEQDILQRLIYFDVETNAMVSSS